MSGSLIPDLFRRALDADGVAVPGALSNFYLTGTLTRTPTYTTAALSVANPNPVVADSGGLFPEIFLDPAVTYRRILTRADGSTLGLDDDPVSVFGATGGVVQYPALDAAAAVNIPSGLIVQVMGFATAGDGGDGFYAPTNLSGPAPGMFQSADGGWHVLIGAEFNPLQFGAPLTGDATAQLQNWLDYSVSANRPANGLRTQFNWLQLNISTGARIRNLRGKLLASTTDFAGLRLSSVSDVRIDDLEIDGNRVSQANMTTFGGDAARHGVLITGRCSDITITQPYLHHAATDNIRCEQGTATSSADDDYCHSNIRIIHPRLDWAGRWGGSSMSQEAILVGPISATGNGVDLAGYPLAPYTNGGNARRSNGNLSTGIQEGGIWDQEDEGVVGGGFRGATFIIGNCLDNSNGISIGSDIDPVDIPMPGNTTTPFVPRRGLTIRGGNIDITGYASGNHPVIVAQHDGYTGTNKTYEGVNVDVNARGNSLAFQGIDGLNIRGTVMIHATEPLDNPVVLTNVANRSIDINTDSDLIPATADVGGNATLPFMVANITKLTGTSGTLGNITSEVVHTLPGGLFRVHVSLPFTPGDTNAVTYELQALPASVTLTDPSISFEDTTTGKFPQSNSKTPGNAGFNSVSFGATPATTNSHGLDLYFTVIPAGS